MSSITFKGNLIQAWNSEQVKMHQFSIMLNRVACEDSKHIDENYVFTMEQVNKVVLIY